MSILECKCKIEPIRVIRICNSIHHTVHGSTMSFGHNEGHVIRWFLDGYEFISWLGVSVSYTPLAGSLETSDAFLLLQRIV